MSFCHNNGVVVIWSPLAQLWLLLKTNCLKRKVSFYSSKSRSLYDVCKSVAQWSKNDIFVSWLIHWKKNNIRLWDKNWIFRTLCLLLWDPFHQLTAWLSVLSICVFNNCSLVPQKTCKKIHFYFCKRTTYSRKELTIYVVIECNKPYFIL